MKMGFIVECGPQGAETGVIPYLARLVNAHIEPDIVPLDRKPLLKRDCGRWTKALLDRGCRHVIIAWDLLPAWGEYEGKGCRHDDKEEIGESLRLSGIELSDKRVTLVCVEKMLEAWILADNEAVATFLSTPTHRVRVPPCRHPDAVKDPEGVLNRLFRGTRYRKYRDLDHALRIVQTVELKRLRRSESFRRFEAKLLRA